MDPIPDTLIYTSPVSLLYCTSAHCLLKMPSENDRLNTFETKTAEISVNNCLLKTLSYHSLFTLFKEEVEVIDDSNIQTL